MRNVIEAECATPISRVILKRTVISMPSCERATGGGTQHLRSAANSSSRLLIEPDAFSAYAGKPIAAAKTKKQEAKNRCLLAKLEKH
jgi:hypothetical protein